MRNHGLRRSLYDLIFGGRDVKNAVNSYFKSLTAYQSSFTSWDGGIYEANLTRACIEAGARQASKLEPNVSGVAEPQATRALLTQPNPWTTTPQFLARVWTCLMVSDTCLIVPVVGADGFTQVGYAVALPSQTTVVEDATGTPWLRMQFSSGDVGLMEWSRVGVMTRHQFRSDFFGDQLNTLDDTLQLIDAQKQAELAAIKNGASVRFLGKVTQNLTPDDLRAKRIEFNESNLSAENAGGLALYDGSFDAVTQVTPTSWTIDASEMERIRTNAHDHFGTNDAILHSCWSEDEWNAFYEGMVEPFAVLLGAVLTSMTYTPFEVANHNGITFSANRLQYASNVTKLNVTTALVDRGIMTTNQALDVWQMPQVGPEGDRRIIRGEYIDASLISAHTVDDAQAALAANALSDSTQQTQGGSNGADAQNPQQA